MKLTFGVAAAFAGCVAAAQQAAEVYMLPSPSSDSPSTPAVSRALARLIFLQRLSPFGKGPSTDDLKSGSDVDAAIASLNQFGKSVPALFGDGDGSAPRQLVVMLEGMTAEQMKEIGHDLDTTPAFTINDPPSTRANEHLFEQDFYGTGLTREHKCSLASVANPTDGQCWSGKSAVAKYNVKKDTASLDDLRSKLVQLTKLAANGEMESTIVLLPSVADSSSSRYWADKSQELRRRQAEQVMSSLDESTSSSSPTASKTGHTVVPTGAIPACFSSKDDCESATGNCSSHGLCQNKYANPDGSDGEKVCFTCHCLASQGESGNVTHWGGAVCSKVDVSVPFWLFAGFTIIMVGILWLAIGMLFSVGEEKLPGVIGAGVSRSK